VCNLSLAWQAEIGPMYRKVMLAYDGSLEGAVALREGAILAKKCGAEVFLLSVVPHLAGLQVAEGVSTGCASWASSRCPSWRSATRPG
jgi:hypothetical protein